MISMKRSITLSLCVGILSALLAGCEPRVKTGDVETASIESVREYLKERYDQDISEIILLEQVYEEEYEEPISIDGSTGFSKTIPAQTKTCYRAYSQDDELYFLIFHSTERKYYNDTLTIEREIIEEAADRIRWAEDFFTEEFVGTDVDWYMTGYYPFYDVEELKPIYDNPDTDVRAAYNRLILDIKNPYSSKYLLITEKGDGIYLEPILNIHVSCTLAELEQNYEELYATYRPMLYTLIYASDGVYNRPYLNEG